MRRHRVIQLDDPPEPARSELMNGAATGPWLKRQIIQSPPASASPVHQNGYEKRWREGDVLCIERQVTSEISGRYGIEDRQEYSLRRVPACVNFRDIQESTTFGVDEGCAARPWDWASGYEHREIEIGLHHAALQGSKKPRGFYNSQQGDRGFLILEDVVGQDRYSYHRSRGAAKQVARELAVDQCRRALNQLVEWYSDGWWWYEAACKFEDYEDRLGGFLDTDDEQYARGEVACTVARMMQADGYTILNWSGYLDYPGEKYAGTNYRERLRQNLNEQNWNYS